MNRAYRRRLEREIEAIKPDPMVGTGWRRCHLAWVKYRVKELAGPLPSLEQLEAESDAALRWK